MMPVFADLKRELAALSPVNGIAPVDILELPATVTPVVRKMMRRGLTLTELAAELDLPLEEARQVGEMLVEKGFLTSRPDGNTGDPIFRVYFTRMRSQNIPIDF